MEYENSVLVLAHSNYLVTDAGVEKVIQGQEKFFLEQKINFIVVYPVRKNVKFLDGIHMVTTRTYELIINGYFEGVLNDKSLLELYQKIQPKAVIIHELVTFRKNQKLFDLFDQIKCPIYYYVHDYAMICYSHILMRNNREFCGTDPLSLKKCKSCKYYLQGKINHNWQQKFVKRYPQIIYLFPSVVVRDIWKKTFPVKNELRIIPNTKFGKERSLYTDKQKNERLRIAFIGYGRVEKGWNIWEKLCEKYHAMYQLYVLGDGESKEDVISIPVSVAKDGPNAMIQAIRSNHIDIAFLWSTVPETYSYTFFESYVSGCYILTNNKSGNIAYMTNEYQCGEVFESEESLFSFLDNPVNVQRALEKMYDEKVVHPVKLINNDEILDMIKGIV